MLLPVAGLCYLALRAGRTQPEPPSLPAAPRPFQLKVVKIERLPLTAQDVSRGADTKIHIKVATAGTPPRINFSNWDWLDDAYITTVGNKRQRRITDEFGRLTSLQKRVIRGGSGGGTSDDAEAYFEYTWRLRLQDVPMSFGALRLQWDVLYGPNLTLNSRESAADKINKIRGNGQGLGISAHMPLRKAGEQVLPVRVSTDPLFDVRKIEVQPLPKASAVGNTRIMLHIFYRGNVSRLKQRGFHADCVWRLGDDRGRTYDSSTQGLFAQYTGGLHRYKIVSEVDTAFLRREVKDKRRLILRGTISLNHAWPRHVVIPLQIRQHP